MKRFPAVAALLLIASCSTTGKFPKKPELLAPEKGIVVFPLVVTETYVNGNSLFADRHDTACSLRLAHDSLTETISAFPLRSGTITGPKSFVVYPSAKQYALPAGGYVTTSIDFGDFFAMGLDQPETQRGKDYGHVFRAEAGAVNYWGRGLLEITYDLKTETLRITSFEIVDESEADLSEFYAKMPAYRSMPKAISIGKRLVPR